MGSSITVPHSIMVARDFIVPLLAFGALIFIPDIWVAYAVAFGGQAHFFMAYLYQKRGGKMDTRYLAAAALLFVFALVYFFAVKDVVFPIFLIAANLFTAHFLIDEATLHGEQWDARRLISAVGFFLLVSVLIVFVSFPSMVVLPLIALGIALATFVLRVSVDRRPLSKTERYVWFVAVLVLLAALLLPHTLSPYSLFGLIVWLHVLNWTIGYGIKVHGRPIEWRYWRETVWTAGLSFGLFLLFLAAPQSPFRFLYEASFYNAWAIAHIVLSYVAALPSVALTGKTAQA